MGNCDCGSYRKEMIVTSAIIDNLMRIKLTCEQYALRAERTIKEHERLLLAVFANETSKRSRMTEKAMIGRTVFAKNMLIVNRYVLDETKTLLQRKSLLQVEENYESLIPSINVLIYCSMFLKDQKLAIFNTLIRQRFPDYRMPVDSDIRYSLIRYHRYTQDVTFEMENQFMLQFCCDYGIEVMKVNEIGHGYQYGAGKLNYQE